MSKLNKDIIAKTFKIDDNINTKYIICATINIYDMALTTLILSF